MAKVGTFWSHAWRAAGVSVVALAAAGLAMPAAAAAQERERQGGWRGQPRSEQPRSEQPRSEQRGTFENRVERMQAIQQRRQAGEAARAQAQAQAQVRAQTRITQGQMRTPTVSAEDAGVRSEAPRRAWRNQEQGEGRAWRREGDNQVRRGSQDRGSWQDRGEAGRRTWQGGNATAPQGDVAQPRNRDTWRRDRDGRRPDGNVWQSGQDRADRQERWRNDGWRNDGRRDGNWRDGTWRNDDRRTDGWRNDRRWDRSWRSNNRYDWSSYRARNRQIYRVGRYYAPYNNYSYRRLGVGFTLGSLFFGQRYWIADPWYYRLPEVYGPYRWVRYYDDVLLVDVYSGQVVDVIYDFFW